MSSENNRRAAKLSSLEVLKLQALASDLGLDDLAPAFKTYTARRTSPADREAAYAAIEQFARTLFISWTTAEPARGLRVSSQRRFDDRGGGAGPGR